MPLVPPWYCRRADILDRLPAAPQLLVVHGPRGCGKTLLLADWTSAQDREVVWLDADQAVDVDRLRSELAHLAASSRSGTPATVVIDGYERLSRDPLDADLIALLRSVRGIRIALGSRTPLVALRLRAAPVVDVAVVGPDDFRLRSSQVAQVLRRSGADPSAADKVRSACDGLALGARVLAVGGAQGDVDLRGAPVDELARFAAYGLVLNLAPPDDDPRLVQTLSRLSVAGELTGDVADELADGPARGLLDRAVAAGLGAWAGVDPERRTFSFFPLARRGLHDHLQQAEPDLVDPLLRIVVRASERHGLSLPALRAAVETGDLALVADVVSQIWGAAAPIAHQEVIALLEQLPGAEVAQDPQLAIFLALHYNADAAHRAKAARWFALAATAAIRRLPSAGPGERALLRTGQSVAARLVGRVGKSQSAASTALELLDDLPPGEDPAVDRLRPLVYRVLGTGQALAGSVEGGVHTVERALASTQTGSLGALHVVSLLSGFAAAQGDLRAAREHLSAIEAMQFPRRPEHVYRWCMQDLARIHVAIDDLDLDLAQQVLDALADELRTNELWPLFAEAQAIVDLRRGHPEAGGVRLGAAMGQGRRAPVSPAWRSRLTASQALLELGAGHGERALRLLEPLPLDQAPVRMARARVLLSMERAGDALPLLAGAELPEEGPRLRAVRRFQLAAASLAQDMEPLARTALREAVAISVAAGSRGPWSVATPAERGLLRDLAVRSGDQDVVVFVDRAEDLRPVVYEPVESIGLSPQEAVVLRHLAGESDLVDVASTLYVSHNTVKTHVRVIYRKLGVSSRRSAVVRARKLGLL